MSDHATHRSETDLRAALALLERLADDTYPPASDDATAMRARRPRRTGAMLAAAALVAALAILASYLVSGTPSAGPPAGSNLPTVAPTSPPTQPSSTPPSPPPTSAPPLAHGYASLPVDHLVFGLTTPGLSVTEWEASPENQSALVTMDLSPATITIYSTHSAPGAIYYDASQAKPTTVNGAPAEYAPIYGYASKDNPGALGIAWHYAPDAWATIADDGGANLSEADARLLAEALDFTATQPLRSPLRFDAQAYTTFNLWNVTTTDAIEGFYAFHIHGVECGADFSNDRSRMIKSNDKFQLDGHVAYFSNSNMADLSIDGGDWVLTLVSGGDHPDSPRLTKAELIDLAHQITVPPDLTRQATWFDAGTAIPTG